MFSRFLIVTSVHVKAIHSGHYFYDALTPFLIVKGAHST